MNKFRFRSIGKKVGAVLAWGDLKAKLILLGWLVVGLVAIGTAIDFILFRESLGPE